MNMKIRTKWRVATLVMMLVVATLVPCASAGTGDYLDATSPEVGVEWVTEYTIPYDDLPWSDDSAEGFYNALGTDGWTKKFNKGNDDTNENQFEFSGLDSYFIDGVDIAYYQGHGDYYATHLSTLSKWVCFDDEIEWGDHDLEWIALHHCRSTQQPWYFKGEHYGLNGVHLICGFDTSSLNYAQDGGNFANRLINDELVRDAWYHAMDESHNYNHTVTVIGENLNCGSDHIWGHGTVISDPPVDQYYVTWKYYLH
jgi:hypothetical protein